MTHNTYDVSFSGVLVEGSDLSQVKNNVAKLFKTDVQKIEVMFSGKRVVIKRDLNQQTAMKYQSAMKNIGAICDVTEKKSKAIVEESHQYSAENPPPIPPPESMASPQSVPTQPAQEVAAEPIVEAIPKQDTNSEGANNSAQVVSMGEMASVTIAPPGETIIEYEHIAEPEIDISAISVDESMSDLIEHTVVPEPNIDVSAISMDRSGDDLVQHEEIAAPELDISAISMDETGVDLTTHQEVPPLEVDISNISLAPPGTSVLEDENKPG
jgi:hypothetical protein